MIYMSAEQAVVLGRSGSSNCKLWDKQVGTVNCIYKFQKFEKVVCIIIKVFSPNAILTDVHVSDI